MSPVNMGLLGGAMKRGSLGDICPSSVGIWTVGRAYLDWRRIRDSSIDIPSSADTCTKRAELSARC